jgi:DHA1 family multidrug resistance protein-like MFS transporter
VPTAAKPREPPPPTPKVGFRSILADPAVRVVMLITFTSLLGFGIVAPILPLFARSFGVGYGAAGLLLSSFAVVRLVFDPVAGPIIDRFGERATATAGLLVLAASSIATGLAGNFWTALALRAIGGGGSSVLFAALYSYLLKVVPKDRMARTLGVFYGSFNIGFIAGGPIGGAIAQHLGLASPLFVYAGLCALAAALYLRFVPNPASIRPEAERSERLPAWSMTVTLLRSRAFLTTAVLNMSFFWVIAGGYDTLVPLFGRSVLRMSTVAIGVVLAIGVATDFLMLFPAGTIADRFGRRALLLPALAWFTAAVSVGGLASTAVTYGLVLGLMGFGSGAVAVVPGAMLSDVVTEQDRATAVGLYRFFGDLGFIFGPLVAGVAAGSVGFRWAFVLTAVPLAASLLLVVWTPETLARRATR